MKNINLDDLANVTGGGLFDNMGTAASDNANNWASTANTALGGGFFGGFGAAVSGFFGGIVGLGQGALHTVAPGVPMPPK